MQRIDESSLYELRTIILLEKDPQSNIYNQVALTPTQYEKFTKYLDSFFEKIEDEELREGFEVVNIKCVNQEYDLSKIAPEIQSSHEE